MKSQYSCKWLFLLLILTTFGDSYAKEAKSISDNLIFSHFLNKANEWIILNTRPPTEAKLEFSIPIVLAGFLCFIAASISSAGGVGGGGLFIPIMTITTGVDLKTASSFSAFMVTGSSIANVVCNLALAVLRFGGKSLIDFDIALLSQPSMLLGVSVGVICNVMFPEWLVTVLFALFLAWSTSKTWRNGVTCWKLETEQKRLRKGCGELENRLNEEVKLSSVKEPLLGDDHQLGDCQSRLPWMKIGVLVLVWCSFCLVYLLRGNRCSKVTSRLFLDLPLIFPFVTKLAITFLHWLST